MKGRSKDRRYGTMKIVIIGSSGRLGAALMREYRDRYDVAGFNRAVEHHLDDRFLACGAGGGIRSLGRVVGPDPPPIPGPLPSLRGR